MVSGVAIHENATLGHKPWKKRKWEKRERETRTPGEREKVVSEGEGNESAIMNGVPMSL